MNYYYNSTWKIEDYINNIECINVSKLPNENPNSYVFSFDHMDSIYTIKILLSEVRNISQAYDLAKKKIKDELFFNFSSRGYKTHTTLEDHLTPKPLHFLSDNTTLKLKEGEVYINNQKVEDPFKIGHKIIKAAKQNSG